MVNTDQTSTRIHTPQGFVTRLPHTQMPRLATAVFKFIEWHAVYTRLKMQNARNFSNNAYSVCETFYNNAYNFLILDIMHFWV